MFGNLNELSLSLHGREKNISTRADKVTAFTRKIEFLVRWGTMDILSCLTEFLVSIDDRADEIKANTEQTTIRHLYQVHEKIFQ
jgi:hypothetical protein